MKPKANAQPQSLEWYVWRKRSLGFGNLWFQAAGGLVYAVAALGPLVQYLSYNFHVPEWTKCGWLVGPWALLVSLGYPTWQWLETGSFDKWLANQSVDKDAKAELRRKFTNDVRLAENFWKALWGVYSVAGILGVALKQ